MYLDPICTYILTRLFPRFLKGLIWLSSKTVLHFLTLNSGTRYLACENFITSYIIIFYYCGICLLLEPRLVEVYRCYLQSWLHVLVLNVANKCSKYIPLRYRRGQLLLTPPFCMDGERRAWTVCYGIGLGTNAWMRRFQDGGCSTLYSPISTQIASSSSACGFFHSVDIFFYIFSYVTGVKDAIVGQEQLESSRYVTTELQLKNTVPDC